MVMVNRTSKKVFSLALLTVFVTSLLTPQIGFCNLVSLSKPQAAPTLVGLKLNPNDPQKIDFIFDTAGKGTIDNAEAGRLVNYFLAGLTIPTKDLWVNLSPYEKSRIVPQALGITDLGKDMLEQDAFLKQLSASLTYPESDLGKAYWRAVDSSVIASKAKQSQLFSKIWIVPGKAEVYEGNNTALITKSSLKAMTENDFLAMQNNNSTSAPAARAMRETILPMIENDINNGANFSTLRQAYNSMILAVWFKEKFEQSFFKHYLNQAKVKGIDLTDKNIKEKIWNQYVEAFKKGAYNYIKEERTSSRLLKRTYFSGGATVAPLAGHVVATTDPAAPEQALSGHELLVTSGTMTTHGFDLDAKDGSEPSAPARDDSSVPFDLDGNFEALRALQEAPMRGDVEFKSNGISISVNNDRDNPKLPKKPAGFALTDLHVVVGGKVYNLLSTDHSAFDPTIAMGPSFVNRSGRERYWIDSTGKRHDIVFTESMIEALKKEGMALVLDSEPKDMIHGSILNKPHVVTTNSDGSITGTVDTNNPNLPELFQGQQVSTTLNAQGNHLLITDEIENQTDEERPVAWGRHWNWKADHTGKPGERSRIKVTIPGAKWVYKVDQARAAKGEGQWPTGERINIDSHEAQELDFRNGRVIGDFGESNKKFYDHVFYLGEPEADGYHYLTIYDPDANITTIIKISGVYTHVVLFTSFWDGARGTLSLEAQTDPTDKFYLQHVARETKDEELAKAAAGVVLKGKEKFKATMEVWAEAGEVTPDQLKVRNAVAKDASAIEQPNQVTDVLADVWPKDATPQAKAQHIQAALDKNLRFSDIEEQLDKVAAQDRENTLTVTLDLGEGRRYTKVLPAEEKYRGLVERWLASWGYAVTVWNGRTEKLKVLVEFGKKATWDKANFFDVFRKRLALRYNSDSGSNRTLQAFGNYGDPIEIELVDVLLPVDHTTVKPSDNEFPKIKYLSFEEFPGVYVCFDNGGQSAKIRASVDGKFVELPLELAVLSFPDGLSGETYAQMFEERARQVGQYLLEKEKVSANGVYINFAGAVRPVSLGGEVAPGVEAVGRNVTFANSLKHWTPEERALVSQSPLRVAQAFGAPIMTANDGVGFDSYVAHDQPGREILKVAIGTGFATQFGSSRFAPQEGSHFEIVLSDDLPRSCEQLGLSTEAIVILAKAFGFNETGIDKLKPVHVGKALGQEGVNHDVAVRVFKMVGELLAEHLYLMSKITGVKTLAVAGGVAQDMTGKAIIAAANDSAVAKKHGLQVELFTKDISDAGAIGGVYAAVRQNQARIARLAQSWGVQFNEDNNAIQIAELLSASLRASLSNPSDADEQQRAAHDILALRVWLTKAVSEALYAEAQRIYQPQGPTGGSSGSGSAELGASSANNSAMPTATGAKSSYGGVSWNKIKVALNAKSGEFYFKRGFFDKGDLQGLTVKFNGSRVKKAIGEIIREDNL